ncbi:MAG: MFS transporter, partial [Longilinea sp.]|nr:MFS transporter [Longilinea sp.]
LIISLVLMIVAVSLLFIVDSLVMFNVIGALAGFALTGVQSVSRTMVGQMAPEERSTEFYGFFSVAGQLSAFIGPALYGFLAAGAAVWYENQGMAILPAEQTGMRVAVIAMVVFLAFGLVLTLTVKKPELVAAEMAESAPQTPA